jgi:hypothetical protein
MAKLLEVHGSTKLVSVNGKQLLNELSEPASADIKLVLTLIDRDKNAGRLKTKDSGDCAYHLLLGSGYNADFVLPVLAKLVEKTPEAARFVNGNGSLPLHICLAQRTVIPEAVAMLLQLYPEAARVPNGQGLILYSWQSCATTRPVTFARLYARLIPKDPVYRTKRDRFPYTLLRSEPNQTKKCSRYY